MKRVHGNDHFHSWSRAQFSCRTQLVFDVRFGLTQAGARVALKVFVILETGNEAGSEVMVLERPAAEKERAAA